MNGLEILAVFQNSPSVLIYNAHNLSLSYRFSTLSVKSEIQPSINIQEIHVSDKVKISKF